MKNSEPNIISKMPTHEDIQFFEDRLYEYNERQTGKDDGNLFSKLINDSNSNIIAGISGWTWAGACEIAFLWVKEEFRNKGYGRLLLQAAEDEARKKNCDVILLRSYNFQAPFFYQKHDYKVEYKTEDFPPGCSYYCLIKRLNELNNNRSTGSDTNI
jgi:ribosomal protein S18 acetylase RimI-like enzyme